MSKINVRHILVHCKGLHVGIQVEQPCCWDLPAVYKHEALMSVTAPPHYRFLLSILSGAYPDRGKHCSYLSLEI